MRRHPVLQMFLIGLVASIVGVAISLSIDWFPASGGSAAKPIDTLYDVLLIVSVPIFVLVMTVAIYSVWRFRAKPGDMSDGAPIHGNTKLEVVWVTIPFVMVMSLAVYGWIVLDDIEAKKPNTLQVNVTGQQFAWSFEHPKQKGIPKPIAAAELQLPINRQVQFNLHTKDVIHSFWVPDFRLKQDVVPGLTTRIRTRPIENGNHPIVCAELCGLGHATMRQTAHVIPQAAFTRWVSQRTGGAKPGPAGAKAPPPNGKQIFMAQGCTACHTLADAGATAKVGPDLDNVVADAKQFGKGQSPAAYIRQSIVNPNAVVRKGFPAGTMPQDYGKKLTPQELTALVSYLQRVGGGKGQ